MTGVAAAAVGFSARRATRDLDERQVPVMGVMGAFVFAAQMINVPVAAGTSGHLLGGVLLAVLLGPWTASVVMSCVLIVQCLLFQDGGITALGANIVNMGIVVTLPGYWIFSAIHKVAGTERGRVVAVFVAGWASVVLSAGFAAVELALSGTVPLRECLMAMTIVHAIIGLFEGALTVTVLKFVERIRPGITRGAMGELP